MAIQDMVRAEAMIAQYRAGSTLAEVGITFGVSRERVKQIMASCGAPRRPSIGGFTAEMRRKGQIARHQNALKRRLTQDALDLVDSGLTFSQAAERLNVTRNTIAGAVWRRRKWAAADAQP